MKVCSRCKIQKDDSEFRIRREKRTAKKECTYLNNTCRQCDREVAKIRYDAEKDKIEFIIKNRERTKKHNCLHKEKVKERNKNKRQRKGYKEYVRDYYRNNSSKIGEQHRSIQKKAREKLSDSYIVARLSAQLGLTAKQVRENEELMELKRLQLLLQRQVIASKKQLKNKRL